MCVYITEEGAVNDGYCYLRKITKFLNFQHPPHIIHPTGGSGNIVGETLDN